MENTAYTPATGSTSESKAGAALAADIHRYFDWAATTPPDSDIMHEALDSSLSAWGNPSSTHELGLKARRALEEARESSAKTLGVKPGQLFFTSGGTESDHIPLLSMLMRQNRTSMRILVSSIEHPALREQAAALGRMGITVDTIQPDKNGFITPEAVAQAITGDTVYVTVMAVNNETGCIQPIYEIADAITRATEGKRRPHFHVDCVQAAGKIPLNLNHPGIDSAAFSAHKICGPRGIGLLYLAKPLNAFLTGGGQEQGIRSGTENLFGAIALSKCLKRYWIAEENAADTNGMRAHLALQEKWTADFTSKIAALPGAQLVPDIRAAHAAGAAATGAKAASTTSEAAGSAVSEANTTGSTTSAGPAGAANAAAREAAGSAVSEANAAIAGTFSPWVVQAAFKNIPGNVMVRALDAKGFAISTGSACSAKKQNRPILAAMQIPRSVQDTAVRFSFGSHTTKEDMDALLQAVGEVVSVFNR
ncbi:MAG: cysteine desulfurase [Treponema sp.]|nr:cysteine desulfurase [Treponema sp.]